MGQKKQDENVDLKTENIDKQKSEKKNDVNTVGSEEVIIELLED